MDLLTAVDDFSDPRARELLSEDGISVDNVYLVYESLLPRAMKRFQECPEEGHPFGNDVEAGVYRKIFRSGAAVHYELSGREVIAIPYLYRAASFVSNGFSFLETQGVGIVTRSYTSEIHEGIGDSLVLLGDTIVGQ